MIYTIPIVDWFKSHKIDEIAEIPSFPLLVQLKAFDDANTGIAFVMLLEPVSSGQEEPLQATSLNMISIPVVKVRGVWVTAVDDGIRDIVSSVVRMVAPINEATNESGPK